MYATYCRLSLPVSASWRDVIRAASTRIVPQTRFTRDHRQVRHAFYRRMLEYHHKRQKLVCQWRL